MKHSNFLRLVRHIDPNLYLDMISLRIGTKETHDILHCAWPLLD